MNRALKKLLSSVLTTTSSSSTTFPVSSSLLIHAPHFYASTSVPSSTHPPPPPSSFSSTDGHHKVTTPTDHDHHASSSSHHDDHGHGHGHHEPEKRKNFEFRSQSGQNSPYENQGEDPNLAIELELPHMYSYRGHWGDQGQWAPYRTHTSMFPLRQFHMALFLSMVIWFYIFHRAWYEPFYMTGHAYIPDVSKFTDEELGIPPDDAD